MRPGDPKISGALYRPTRARRAAPRASGRSHDSLFPPCSRLVLVLGVPSDPKRLKPLSIQDDARKYFIEDRETLTRENLPLGSLLPQMSPVVTVEKEIRS